jgi:hypothetical protein
MTEIHGTDISESISVRDLNFRSQFTLGAARWLEHKMGKPIMEALKELSHALQATTEEYFDTEKSALFLTALYISANPGIDPNKAETIVNTLTFDEMAQVILRARPFEVEPKNSRPAETPETPASTGPVLSTA